MSLPISFFETSRAGVVTKHMQQGVAIREFLTSRLLTTLLDFPALLIFLPLMAWYSVSLTILVFLVTLLLGGVIALMLGPYRRRLRRLYQAEAQRQSLLVESVHGMRTVKIPQSGARREESWDNAAADAVRSYVQVGKISLAAGTFSQFIEKLLTITIVVVGLVPGVRREADGGRACRLQHAVVARHQPGAADDRPAEQLPGNHDVRGNAGRGDEPPRREQRPARPHPAAVGCHRAGARDVPLSRHDRPALRDVTLAIPAGAMVGIVGRSGSGKTTLSALLQGLHYAGEGSIRIDGHNIRDLDLAYLRGQSGVVPQEPFLFRGSVKDNIRMGLPTASFEEVVRAARMAGADDFIQELPQRYDTELEEGAVNLSGGQKQRLSIARALLRRPRIIIFDEATSALDPESEAVVVQNLKQIAKGRTTIVISHRLADHPRCRRHHRAGQWWR